MPHYSTKNIYPLQGGCPCGLTRYQISVPPLLIHCCHCTACQRELGTAFALNAVIESTNVQLLAPAGPQGPAALNEAFARLTFGSACADSGSSQDAAGEQKQDKDKDKNKDAQISKVNLVSLPSESTIGITVAQCPSCHTGLWTYYADGGPHVTYIRVGTLDAGHELDPDVHIFTRSKRDFVGLDDGKPQFEGYYEDRGKFIREDCKERFSEVQLKTDMSSEYKADLIAALKKQ